jgi:hypothetical protein
MTPPTPSVRWIPIAFFLAAAVLFYFANRAAYKGYFSDDDLTNIGWPTFVGNNVFYHGLVTPKFDGSNFRPVGFLYYRIMGRTFKLHYKPYVAVVQVFHALNVIILFFLLRRLNLSEVAAGAGALFYAFHAAVMAAYWKPMYVFDLLCATLCLLTLLLYIRGHWILALPLFWLAYKSKEIAVMLPVALLAYEWLLGRRNWERLIPFFAISLCFGVQALVHNTHLPPENTYTMHFTPQLLWGSIGFYSSAIFFLPFAGLALLALPVFVRDRRLYLGLILMASTLLPMLLLTTRVATVYMYVPMIGLAIAVAAVASRVPSWTVAAFFVIWLPLNYAMLLPSRKAILAQADEARWYLTGLRNYASRIPPVKTIVFEGTPPYMEPWGVEGAILQAFGVHADVVWYRDRNVAQAMAKVPMAIVTYYSVPHIVRGMLRIRNELQSEINFSDKTPDSQFGDGWYPTDATSPIHWASPKAEVTLYRPAGSQEFEIACSVPERNLVQEGPSKVTVLEDGHSLGVQSLFDPKGQTLRWKLHDGAVGNERIMIVSEPIRHGAGDSRDYGIAIKSLGYVAP